jgi:hypothetical protein
MKILFNRILNKDKHIEVAKNQNHSKRYIASHLDCNYKNNYYGDQQCIASTSKK